MKSKFRNVPLHDKTFSALGTKDAAIRKYGIAGDRLQIVECIFDKCLQNTKAFIEGGGPDLFKSLKQNPAFVRVQNSMSTSSRDEYMAEPAMSKFLVNRFDITLPTVVSHWNPKHMWQTYHRCSGVSCCEGEDSSDMCKKA